MPSVVMLHKHTLEELSIINDTAEQKAAPLPLKPEIRFQLLPQKEKQPLIARISIEIGDMDGNSPLYLKLRMRGLFVVVARDPADAPPDAKDLRAQAFVQLFDCARALISGTMLSGGIAPLMLPPVATGNSDAK